MKYYYRVEFFSSFLGAAQYISDSAIEGWLLDPEDLPDIVGFTYRVSLRSEVEPRVVLSRAECMSMARAARKVKAEEDKNANV